MDGGQLDADARRQALARVVGVLQAAEARRRQRLPLPTGQAGTWQAGQAVERREVNNGRAGG